MTELPQIHIFTSYLHKTYRDTFLLTLLRTLKDLLAAGFPIGRRAVVGKLEKKNTTLRRLTIRCGDDIKMDLT